MRTRVFAAALLSAAMIAGAASAQGGPMSVGLSTDPESRSLHCAAAIFTEMYLIQEEHIASPYKTEVLQEWAKAWTEDAARRAGMAPAAFIQTSTFVAVSESKLNTDAVRQAQVGWCKNRTPPG